MVVCKCRKATKLYCFVHKFPVCGECICSPEHHICVVKTYSEWVIDGDYDWPPKCGQCHELLHGEDITTIRLGCLHVFHRSCLVSYLQSLPTHTAPAGYTCPTCGASIWPPKVIKDLNTALSSKLKDVISQSGLSKNLLGSESVNVEHGTTPIFSAASLPSLPSGTTILATTYPVSFERNNGLSPSGVFGHDASIVNVGNYSTGFSVSVNKENISDTSSIHAPMDSDGKSMGQHVPHSTLNVVSFGKAGNLATSQAGATTRKMPYRGEKMNFIDADNDDDDGATRKYNRRGSFHRKVLRYLLPFWSPAMPTLPVTTPGRKDDRDASVAEELIEGRHRRRHRSSTMDPGKILLVFAILSCLATMILLYYRLSQGAFRGGLPQVEEQ